MRPILACRMCRRPARVPRRTVSRAACPRRRRPCSARAASVPAPACRRYPRNRRARSRTATLRPSTSVCSNQASISSATFSGVPTTTGPAPPMPTCSTTSRTVQTRSGSARVTLSSRGAAGVVLDVANLLVEIVGGEIDAGPPRHQRQRALGIDVAAIVGVFRIRLGLGAAENDRHHAEHQDLGRVAADFRWPASRIAATRGPMILADGPDMNTHSACWAANCRPRGEVPAWYSTGVRCGDGSLR